MSEETRPLSQYLTQNYVGIKRRLTQMLGNGDAASDALQDTYIRVQGQSHEEQSAVRSPLGFLLRVAINIALDAQRRNSRMLSWDEVNELHALADEAPGPAQVAQARSDMKAVTERVSAMPQRRKDIFVLVHGEGMELKEVAQRLGISQRTVNNELKRAQASLTATMGPDTK